jgi:DNA (cytosine-5)-methyltransferase 1
MPISKELALPGFGAIPDPSPLSARRASASNAEEGGDTARMLQVWSLFTGAGGLDLGMSKQGLHARVAVEKEPVYCDTLRYNLPSAKILHADVSALRTDDLRKAAGSDEVDVLIGGPPCQSFSTGGGRAGLSDPRGNLIFEYLRIIRDLQPKIFVLENVANLITAALRHRPIDRRPGQRWNLSSYSQSSARTTDNHPMLEPDEMSGSAVRYLIKVIEDTLGYAISLNVLDAAAFGAPQHRHRLLIVGDRDGKAPAPPTSTHGPGLTPNVTVRDAIADLVTKPGPGSAYTDEVRRVFELVPPGGNWRCLPADVARAAMGERSYAAGGGKTGFFRRLAWDAPSPTITGRSNRKGSALCHPEATRPLSVRECARLQGFPDYWCFAGSAADQYMQVGNAVPVALGSAVGDMVAAHLEGSAPIELRTVDEMLDEAVTTLRATARNKRGRNGPAAAGNSQT